jgi:hypothetical protein
MSNGFPDRAGSSSHTIRLKVRSVLTDEWQSLDDIREAIKNRWPDEDTPTKTEVGASLKTLQKWNMVIKQNGATISKTSINKSGTRRKRIGWKLGHEQ